MHLKTDSRIERDLRAEPRSVTKGKFPLTTGFGASEAAEGKTALREDLTHDWRRQGPKNMETVNILEG